MAEVPLPDPARRPSAPTPIGCKHTATTDHAQVGLGSGVRIPEAGSPVPAPGL